MKFSLAKIEVGSKLTFIRDEIYKAIIDENNKIQLEGEITSLSKSTSIILNRNFGLNWGSYNGPNFWLYNNESLSERRLRLENED